MNKQKDMSLTFEQLISSIRHVHDQLAAQAGRAVNISLTLRNWAIGHYIHEYEQNGSDRAQYGERLLDRLAEQLQKSGLKRVESRELRRYRQFYQLYPQIRESVTPELNQLLLGGKFPLTGDTHGFVDLVFYHRILKCHVLIELKVDEFSHQHLGQLNTYISWYKKNIMTDGDNPPVGILLCTQKDYPLVEYALAGMDNQLFVSKYQLELPKKEEMQRFLAQQLKEVGCGE